MNNPAHDPVMNPVQTYEITILPGTSRDGEPEGFDRIVIHPGDTLSIVGPTGSGKSAFINDIEVSHRMTRRRDAASWSTARSPRKTSCATRQKNPSR